jgi:lipoprotein-anchoring transpeptidase ErfK/SrfK
MKIRKIYLSHPLADSETSNGLKHPLPQQVEHMLQMKGFYQRPGQDIHSPETREAILAFQKAEKLAQTGILDPLTYCRLCDADISEIIPLKESRRADQFLSQGKILITKSSRQLTLWNGNTQVRSYPVGIGKPSTPTPEGNYAIATKILNPGGMLGTRWMGLNFDPDYGIHGNNAPWSIGHLVSHGCVRMYNNHVEEVFNLVRLGTPVIIR